MNGVIEHCWVWYRNGYFWQIRYIQTIYRENIHWSLWETIYTIYFKIWFATIYTIFHTCSVLEIDEVFVKVWRYFLLQNLTIFFKVQRYIQISFHHRTIYPICSHLPIYKYRQILKISSNFEDENIIKFWKYRIYLIYPITFII